MRTSKTCIFISFRGDDGEFAAVAIDAHARERFGDIQVFRSSRSIGPGEVFPPEIIEAVNSSRVVLVVAGPDWPGSREDGSRRIDDQDDWVRQEVRLALAGGKRVVVVRIKEAPRMADLDLPEDIEQLKKHQDVVLDRKDIDLKLRDLMRKLFEREPELRIGAADGLRGLDEWWARWSAVTRPALPAALPIAGREEQVAALGHWLERPPGQLTLRSRVGVEGIAFVAAALDATQPNVRAVLVETEQGAAHCDGMPVPLLVVVATEGANVQSLVAQGMHVLLLSNSHESAGDGVVLMLPRLRADKAYDVLLRTGLPAWRARKLAGVARRSLSVLRWTLDPGGRKPAWANGNMSGLVLAGSWTTRDGSWSTSDDGYADLDAVVALLQKERGEVEEFAQRAATSAEPLVHRSGTRWQLTDPEAAWLLLRADLTTSILQRWHAMAVEVLAEVDPLLDAEVNRRFTAKMLGAGRRYTDDLRRAVATAAALMGADSGDVALASGRRPGDHAADLVHELFERCNADRSGKTWQTVTSKVLPLLAEAAPEEFLSGLEESLSGQHPLMAQVLDGSAAGRPGLFEPHVYVLWSLETLCWSPTYLPRAVRVLARLADVVVFDERRGGSPLDSLRRVFQPGWAYTSAALGTRFQVLDGLRRRHPDLRWTLLLALVAPEPSSRLHHRTHEPEFRVDWLPDEDGPSPAEQEATFDGLTDRVLTVLRDEPRRWADLVPLLDYTLPAVRDRVVDALKAADLNSLDVVQRRDLWEELDERVRFQRSYADLAGAPVVDVLEAVAARIEPRHLAERHAWLFGWRPRLPDVDWHDLEGYDRELEARRVAAVSDVESSSGIAGLTSLAGRSERPEVVGDLTARVSGDRFLDEIVLLLDHGGNLAQFARRWVEVRAAEGGDQWLRSASTRMTTWSSRGQAAFLLAVSRSNDVDDLLAVADEEAVETFWREVPTWPPIGRDVPRFVGELLVRGRAWSVIDLLVRAVQSGQDHEWARSSGLIIETLWAAVSVDAVERPGQAGAHDAGDLLDHLTSLIGEDPEVVLLELAYRHLLMGDRPPKALYYRAERYPEAFVELIRVSVLDDEEHLTFRLAAHTVLRDWRWQPDGQLGLDRLHEWRAEVRELLTGGEDRLRRSADVVIGHFLSGVPAGEDGAWPAEVVRDLLDDPDEKALGNGFVVGVLANHGTTFRGEYDGGGLEYRRAAGLERDADRIAPAWPGAAAVLRKCAKKFRNLGEAGDDDADDTQDEF